MSWESDLLAVLTDDAAVAAIVGGRVFGGDGPQGETALPRIVFSLLAQAPSHTHQGRDGSDENEVEVRCVARTYEAARELAEAVDAALPTSLATESIQLWLKQGEADVFEPTGAAEGSGLHTVVLTYTAMGAHGALEE